VWVKLPTSYGNLTADLDHSVTVRRLKVYRSNENLWSAAGLQGRSYGERQVCGNVFGL
jgi:hypothetical protein